MLLILCNKKAINKWIDAANYFFAKVVHHFQDFRKHKEGNNRRVK